MPDCKANKSMQDALVGLLPDGHARRGGRKFGSSDIACASVTETTARAPFQTGSPDKKRIWVSAIIGPPAAVDPSHPASTCLARATRAICARSPR
jgi:hypothetical protein